MQLTIDNVHTFEPEELREGIATGTINLAELAIPVLSEVIKGLVSLIGHRSRLRHRVDALEIIVKAQSELLKKITE